MRVKREDVKRDQQRQAESLAPSSRLARRSRAGVLKVKSGRKLGRHFFTQHADILARQLIGKVLVRRIGGRTFRARVVEAEAYMGPQDLASHSSKGRTARTEVMFGPAGRAYVYLIYGMYQMLNIVCGKTGEAHAVLVRAAEPLNGWQADLSGPGRMARALSITRADNGLDLTGDSLFLVDDGIAPARIARTRRVGVDYAGDWKDAPLRFFDADSPAVSRRRFQ